MYHPITGQLLGYFEVHYYSDAWSQWVSLGRYELDTERQALAQAGREMRKAEFSAKLRALFISCK